MRIGSAGVSGIGSMSSVSKRSLTVGSCIVFTASRWSFPAFIELQCILGKSAMSESQIEFADARGLEDDLTVLRPHEMGRLRRLGIERTCGISLELALVPLLADTEIERAG